LLCSCIAQAQTIEVSGSQSGVWDAETVIVTGDVKVQDSLTILPGTTVLFKDYYQIVVEENASLKALGRSGDSIIFTVADTTGFHIFNSGVGGWNGIRLNKAGQSKFDYCRFQFGKAALDRDQDGGALRITNCDDVEIGHSKLFCNFSREHGGALNAELSNVVMHDCDVYNNLNYTRLDTVYAMYGGGMRFLKCKVELTDMVFRYNIGETAVGGALSLDSCSVNIDRCIFEHNYGINGAGLYLIRSNDNPCSISNSLFANNTSGHFGGGLAISDSSPEVSNLTVVNNHSIGVNCGGIFFYQHSSPVVRNCIVYGNTNEAALDKPVQMWVWTYDDFTPSFYNSLIEFGLENISGADIINTYENCLNKDPRFVDPEREDFRLRENSPCINSGLTKAADFRRFDLDKNPRVFENFVDMGAYEFTIIGLEETAQANKIRIVGNPITASSYAEIDLDNAGNVSVQVYSLDGKLLTNKNIGLRQSGLLRLEIGEQFQALPHGAYLMVVKAENQTFVEKVVR